MSKAKRKSKTTQHDDRLAILAAVYMMFHPTIEADFAVGVMRKVMPDIDAAIAAKKAKHE